MLTFLFAPSLAALRQVHWKYLLDKELERAGSSADIIAIVDDDACLLDHFVLDDIVDPRTGKLIAHGVAGQSESWKDTQGVRALNLTYVANFMTDFPVFVWREMLPDLRAWLIAQGTDGKQNVDIPFWQAWVGICKKVFAHTPKNNGWGPP